LLPGSSHTLIESLPLPHDHLLQHEVAGADPVAALCVHIEGATRMVSWARKFSVLRVFDEVLGEWAANIRYITIRPSSAGWWKSSGVWHVVYVVPGVSARSEHGCNVAEPQAGMMGRRCFPRVGVSPSAFGPVPQLYSIEQSLNPILRPPLHKSRKIDMLIPFLHADSGVDRETYACERHGEQREIWRCAPHEGCSPFASDHSMGTSGHISPQPQSFPDEGNGRSLMRMSFSGLAMADIRLDIRFRPYTSRRSTLTNYDVAGTRRLQTGLDKFDG
jgi:hypothetical protein